MLPYTAMENKPIFSKVVTDPTSKKWKQDNPHFKINLHSSDRIKKPIFNDYPANDCYKDFDLSRIQFQILILLNGHFL
jgi:hypothetical protein